MDELENSQPSDFVSLIDIWYKDRVLYSKVIWGIPNSDGANGWFYNCPFRIDLFHHSAENNENNNGEVFLSTISDLPSVPSMEQERKYGKLWRELNDGIKLSWIIVNRKKGGPGAAVEPTVCNRKVPDSSPSLCTFVWVKLGA